VGMNAPLHYYAAAQRQARINETSCRLHHYADLPKRERRSLRLATRLLALLHRPRPRAARPVPGGC